jgi:hypothetical protein
MRNTFKYPRLVIALIAGIILVADRAPASADEPYRKVTVEELKRIQKQNDEEQKRLEATPEYQEKKRLEEEARRRREHDEFVRKEHEMKLKMDAAELDRKRLENERLANQGSMSQGGSGGTSVVVTPTIGVNPYGWYGYVRPIRVVPRVPVIRPAIRIRR